MRGFLSVCLYGLAAFFALGGAWFTAAARAASEGDVRAGAAAFAAMSAAIVAVLVSAAVMLHG